MAMREGWTPVATSQVQIRGTHAATKGVEKVRLFHADRLGLHEARIERLRQAEIRFLEGPSNGSLQ